MFTSSVFLNPDNEVGAFFNSPNTDHTKAPASLSVRKQVPNDFKMAEKYIISTLLLLVLITNVRTQFFDFFGFQPIVQQQTRPIPKNNDNNRRYDQEQTTKRSISYNYDDSERDSVRQSTQKAIRRKTTTLAPLFTFNFFSTTAKPVRRTKTTQRTTISTRKVSKQTSKETTKYQDGGRLQTSSYEGTRNVKVNDWYEKPVLSNIADDYYNRQETTTKRFYNNQNNNNYNNQNNNNQRPINQNNNNYNNQNNNNQRPNNYDYNNNNNQNSYTTKNPFYNRPGVKPAVAENRPPITNRPVTKPATHRPVIINPRPTDAGAIVFPQDDVSPEIITGPDEDYMSAAEKRRHIEIAEKMCDRYKELNTKQVQAIPLLPSPEPVEVNISSCAPTTIPLVVGGKVVSIREFPHMALLGWLKLEGGGYSWKCGGSLISDKYVLTAGHCAYQERDNTVVTGPPRAVQLGSSYLDDAGALVARVAAVVRHPKYKFPKSYYDVALLKLASSVSFSEVIKPACLGVPPPVGDPIIATGWGRTEFGGDHSLELRSVSLPVWDITECWNVLGTSRRMPEGPSSDSQMCAGEKKGGKDTCQGDSGGPAQIQDGCIWRVVAVTSLGRSCGAPHTPGLYAIVHRAFISAQVFGDQTNNNNHNNNNKNQQNNRATVNRQANVNKNTDDRTSRDRSDYNVNQNNNNQNPNNNQNNRQINVNKNMRTNNNDTGYNSNVNNNHRTESYSYNNGNNNNGQQSNYGNNNYAINSDVNYNSGRVWWN